MARSHLYVVKTPPILINKKLIIPKNIAGAGFQVGDDISMPTLVFTAIWSAKFNAIQKPAITQLKSSDMIAIVRAIIFVNTLFFWFSILLIYPNLTASCNGLRSNRAAVPLPVQA